MHRFLMGLITGGVVSVAALGLLSQWMMRGSDLRQAVEQSASGTERASGLQSGPVPVETTMVEPETQPSEIDETVSAEQPVAETLQPPVSGETDQTAQAQASVVETPTEEIPVVDVGPVEDAPLENSTSEDVAAEVIPAQDIAGQTDAPAMETGEAPETTADAPSTDISRTDQSEGVAQTGPEPVDDPTANAPVPDVSQSLAQVSQPETVTIVAPTVVDRATGEQVDVTASLRRAVPNAPSPEGAAAGSTTPAARPLVVIPAEDSQPDTDQASGEGTQEPDTQSVQTDRTQTETTQSGSDETTAETGEAQTANLAPSPTIGTKSGDLKSLTPDIKINRLPTLGNAAEPEADATPEVQDLPEVDLSDKPVLERFATSFANPDEKPLMSIILMDQGAVLDGADVGVEALDQFKHPVTLAVDSGLPDAAARMKRYRDAGFEVMAIVDIPEGFTAQDTEVSMGVILSDLPEVIGVLEGVGSGIQSDREISRQVATILAQTGHGLITQDKGLNTGLQFAERSGVPAQTVFGDLDSKDQTAVVIRRFLDQAAFRAGQQDGIVMLGRVRPETISALLLWGVQDRAQRVAIAPASAVLMKP